MKKTIFARYAVLFAAGGLLLALTSCAAGDRTGGMQDNETVALPSARPEDHTVQDQKDDAPAAVLKKTRMNYDFIVRYTQSDFDRTAQLEVPSAGTTGWKWASSDPAVAMVSDAGLVTCGTQPGEAKITATSDGEQAECWVYVLEPKMYMRENSFQPFYFQEGDITLQNYEGADLDSRIQNTNSRTAIDLLPYLFVENGPESDIGAFSAPGAGGGAAAQRVDTGMVDQDGNPIMVFEEGTQEPEEPSDGDIGLHLGWFAVYFGGRYRLPSRLRSESAVYTPTSAYFEYESYIQEISIPASITSMRDADSYWSDENTSNPFAKFVDLERFSVDAGNPSYASDENGVLLSADGKTLIAVPAAMDAKEYTVPDTVTAIGGGAFANNKNIETLTIPATVRSVSGTSFAGMASLKKVVLEDGNDALFLKDSALFGDGGKTLLAVFPNDMPAEFTVEENVTAIGPQVFSNNSAVKSLTINASANELSITDCSALETLRINGDTGVLNVSGCGALKSVEIDGNVSSCSIDSDKVESVSIAGKVDTLTLHSDSLKTLKGTENVESNIQLTCKTVPGLELSDTLELLTITMDGDGTLDLGAVQGGRDLNRLEVQSYSAVITVEHLSAVAKLRKLEALTLRSVKADNWPVLWKCGQLRQLNIQHCDDFASLEGIGALTELLDLSVSGTAVSDISPLAGCKGLTDLDISDCANIKDISCLEGLSGLRLIAAYGTDVPQEQKDGFMQAGVTVY